ncbi:pre-mRNA-splicing factor Cwc2p [Trichomonascus vanleenenianus]|uniref:active spliceosome conformation promoter CWC2 n=1 Tax=Trichomonascus vanleenenianus TaxID=2268995 RepID=UPI003ECACB61
MAEERQLTKREKKGRPARVQKDIESIVADDKPPQTGTVFNIWYLKWSGGDSSNDKFRFEKAVGRCNITRDSGYTKADKTHGAYFCLFFARGVCYRGKKCEYLHRLPTVTDIFSPNYDCFGRDRHADYRDDMRGVGSFMRQNRTLYVGRIKIGDDMDEVVSRHFSEWGDIDRIRVLHSRGVAFVTYMNEINAQFAKEAMDRQSLDGEEVLSVRWATEDPNPASHAREQRRIEEQAAEVIRKILPPEAIEELESGQGRSAKRIKSEAAYGLKGYEAPDDIYYNQPKINAIEPEAGNNEGSDVGKRNADDDNATKKGNVLISSHTLDKLKGLATATAKPAPRGLVSYDDDDDDDDDDDESD